MSMLRCICGVKSNERQESEKLRKMLGLELVSMNIFKTSRLRGSGHVERKDNSDMYDAGS